MFIEEEYYTRRVPFTESEILLELNSTQEIFNHTYIVIEEVNV